MQQLEHVFNLVMPEVSQEFLLETGAVRTMPEEFKEHVIDAPERVEFPTGGGIRKLQSLESKRSTVRQHYILCIEKLSSCSFGQDSSE